MAIARAIQIKNFIFSLIAVGLMAWFVIGVGSMAYGSFSAHVAHSERMVGTDPEKLAASYERAYMEICPAYAKLSTWDKFWSGDRWCEDYLHRLPEAVN